MEELSVGIARARDAAFDWEAEGAATRDLERPIAVATGMRAVLAVYNAIEQGVFPGRKLDWATTIACVTKAQALRFMQENEWAPTPEFAALPEDEPYYFVVTDES